MNIASMTMIDGMSVENRAIANYTGAGGKIYQL